MASVCTPVPSACLEDVITAEMVAKHGASAAGALIANTHLKGSRSYSFIDRPFRDPDFGSLVEPETRIPLVIFGVGSVNNLVLDFERHKLRKGEWEYIVIVPGTGPRLLAKDLTNQFFQNMDISASFVECSASPSTCQWAGKKPTDVIRDAQKLLSTLMDKGVEVVLCLNAATSAYAQGVFLDPSKPGNPDLLDQLFDRRIKLGTSGVGYATELSAQGVAFWELH